jgi:multidrug efflux pump
LALHHRPERFFPGAGYRCDSGHLRSTPDHFLSGDGRKQQALAQVILKDPAVESLSSFIGVDGINTTLNSGRILINLKPWPNANKRDGRDAPVAAGVS